MASLAASSGKLPIPLALDGRGLFLHLGRALHHLRRVGHRCNITSPRVATRLLREFGTSGHRVRVGGVQMRLFFIPAAALRRLGYEIGDGSGDGEDEARDGSPDHKCHTLTDCE